MRRSLFLSLFRVEEANTFTRMRIRYIQIMALFAIVGTIIGTILVLLGISTTAVGGTVLTSSGAYVIVNLALLVMVRRRWTQLASLILIGTFVVASMSVTNAWLIPAAIVAVLSAAILGNRLIFFGTVALVFGKIAVNMIVFVTSGIATTSPDMLQHIALIITLVIVAIATRFFVTQADKSAEAAKGSASLLQAVAEAGEILAKLLNLNALLPRAVELIQERFGFYHVQVFLLDETNEYVSLAASTGATGQKLLEKRHRLAVGSKSVIGQVTLVAQPVIARDTDAIYYRNELLPNTRAELALPIMDGDKLIGVLDVQSRQVDAFEADAVQALQVMANLLGTSIRNARFFEQQDLSARETRRLFLESETSLREIQRLNQQLTKQGWENYLRNRRRVNGVTMDDQQMIADDRWTDMLVKASETRQPVMDNSSGTAVIAVPVMLGSEVIGAIEVEPGSGRENETVEMVKAVAQRLALSLDKARLYEESQEATAQEQRINEIVARYQTVTSVDDLLQITLAELSSSLGAKRGAIRLGVGGDSSLNGESQA